MSLPKGFKRLAYIQSSGTQYIDSGFIPNQDTRVDMVAVPLSTDETGDGTGFIAYGAGDTYNKDAFECYTGNAQYFLNYDGQYQWTRAMTVGEKVKISHNKNVVTLSINGGAEETYSFDYKEFTAPKSMTLFAINRGTAVNGAYILRGHARIFSCQIYDNGTMVRDYIPCQTTSGEIGLWDDVGGVFYGNAGTGTFTAGAVISEAVDESEITELEYIQSSGTQYVKTNFYPNNNTRVFMDFAFAGAYSGNIGLCGARTSSASKTYCFWFYTDYITSCRFDFASNSEEGTEVKLSSGERLTLDMNQNTCVCGDFSQTKTDADFQCDYDLALFGINTTGTVGALFTGQMYAGQIFDNGLLERDYIPAKLANGEVGLYDRVFKEFYRNAGTGEFTAGPEMVHEDYTELEYIEGSGAQYVDSGHFPVGTLTMRAKVYQPFENAGIEQAIFGSSDSTNGIELAFSATQNRVVLYSSAAAGYNSPNTVYDTVFDVEGIMADTSPYKTLRLSLDGGVEVTSITANVSGWKTHTVSLFALNKAYFFSGRVYRAELLDDDFAVRIYIPMLHPSSTAGLWDSVNERFYATATTTDFIAGPEAQTVPKAPENFRVEAATDTLVTLAWDASDKAVGYRLYRSGQLLADTTETSVSVAVEPFAGAVFTLTAYNENGEGAGATLTHYSIPENPLLYLITDRTQQDVAERNPKGYYAASDLNRVGYAMNYVSERIVAQGRVVSISPKLDWADTGWVSAADAAAYLKDLKTLRAALEVPAATPDVPEDMEGFTYTEANEVEMILLTVDKMLTLILNSLLYAGEVFAGEV